MRPSQPLIERVSWIKRPERGAILLDFMCFHGVHSDVCIFFFFLRGALVGCEM